MRSIRHGTVMCVVIGIATACAEQGVCQDGAVAPRSDQHVSFRSDAARLSPQAAAVWKRLQKQPGELMWQQIPWLEDLPEAFRQAKAENRPVLVWATDNDPLDRC